MFPDFSELIVVMKAVVTELQKSQQKMDNLSHKIDNLIEALEV